jgi:hypothetical protein
VKVLKMRIVQTLELISSVSDDMPVGKVSESDNELIAIGLKSDMEGIVPPNTKVVDFTVEAEIVEV